MKKYHSLYNPVGLRNRQEPNKDMYTPSDSVSVPLKHLRVHAPATSALKNNMLLDQKHKQIQEDISTYTTPYPSEHNVRLVDLDSENKNTRGRYVIILHTCSSYQTRYTVGCASTSIRKQNT